MNFKATLVALVFLVALMAAVFFLLDDGERAGNRRSLLNAVADDRAAPAGEPATNAAPQHRPGQIPSRLRWTPETRQAYIDGQKAYAIGDYQTALDFYRAALAINPDLAEVHLGMALAYERMGAWERAYGSMKRHLELVGTLPEPGARPAP